MSSVEWLGFLGGLLTTGSFIPQIIRVVKLKSAREISLIFNTTMTIGGLVWLSYGVILELPAVIVWNTVGFILNVILLITKLKYGRKASVE